MGHPRRRLRDEPRLIRTTARGGADPGARRAFIGFRPVDRPAPALTSGAFTSQTLEKKGRDY